MWEGSGHGYLRAADEEGGFEFWTKMVEGGSSKRRRIWGKFREMLLAWKLELGRGGAGRRGGGGGLELEDRRREATAAQFFRVGGGRLLRGGNFKFPGFGREHVSMWRVPRCECDGVSAQSSGAARPFRVRWPFRDAEIGRRLGLGCSLLRNFV